MRDFIVKLVRSTVEVEITKQLERQGDEKITPEQFANRVASQIELALPAFEQEVKRDFDDPHDSFSTELYTRFVTPWVEKWQWDRKVKDQSPS